jgi:hypothetical protein
MKSLKSFLAENKPTDMYGYHIKYSEIKHEHIPHIKKRLNGLDNVISSNKSQIDKDRAREHIEHIEKHLAHIKAKAGL